MSDPLTALMYAVQVMNFLKTLIVKTLREREDSILEAGPVMQLEPSDDDRHHSILKSINAEEYDVREQEELSVPKEVQSNQDEHKTINETHGFLSSIENILTDGKGHIADTCLADILNSGGRMKDVVEGGNTSVGSGRTHSRIRRTKSCHPRNSNHIKKGSTAHTHRPEIHHHINEVAEKNKEVSIIRRVNSYTERTEAWR